MSIAGIPRADTVYLPEPGYVPDNSVLFGLGWGGLVLALLALVFGLMLLSGSFYTVGQQTVAIVERLGKFHTASEAGLHFKLPLIDRIAQRVSMKVEQLKVNVDVRLASGEFITLPVTVFFQVIEGCAKDSFYAVSKPADAIEALVQNDVKALAAGMNFDEIFASRDAIKNGVIEKLAEELGGYGFMIANALVDNPVVPPAIEDAFNDVTAAQQRQRAATADAEALKIKRVGEATAEAEALEIRTRAMARARTSLAEGNAKAIIEMCHGTDLSHGAALQFLLCVDTNEAVRDASSSGATVVVATGKQQDGLFATLPESVALNGTSA